MAERTDLRPVQVFLDTRRFIEIPPTEPRPRAAKDFFKDNDKAFAEHKARMTSAMTNAAAALRTTKQPAGFVRVRQRSDALAKSHRPMNALFSESHGFSLVGAETAGELLFQATSNGLDRLARIVEEHAEPTPSRSSTRPPRRSSLASRRIGANSAGSMTCASTLLKTR